jgi:phytoene dehydrogenase-like protein
MAQAKATTIATSIAIIGGGHNGLTAAAYLAAQGFSVEVFEKRDIIGGLCVNETPFRQSDSRAKVSSVASYFGMMRKEIMADLRSRITWLEALFD